MKLLSTGGFLENVRSTLRLAPTLGYEELLRLMRWLPRTFNVGDPVGCGSEICVSVESSDIRVLERIASSLACILAENLGWNARVSIVSLMGDGYASWSISLEDCEPLRFQPLDPSDVATLVSMQARKVTLVMSEFGLQPGDLDKLYSISVTLIDPLIYKSGDSKLICTGLKLELDKVFEGSVDLRIKEPSPTEGEQVRLIEEFLTAKPREPDRGFLVSAVDPLAMHRSLCTEDVVEALREAGYKIEDVLGGEGLAREEHSVIKLERGVLVEVNCSAYLDSHNWVRIHGGDEGKATRIALDILIHYYERRLSEEENQHYRRIYESLLELAKKAESLQALKEAVTPIRDRIKGF